MVAVVEEQGVEIGLRYVIHRTCEFGRWVHRRRGDDDSHEVENEPEVYHPEPVSATLTMPGRGQSGHGELGMHVRVHDMISHRQVPRMPEELPGRSRPSFLPGVNCQSGARTETVSNCSAEPMTVTEGCQ